jgi:regulator of sigma D
MKKKNEVVVLTEIVMDLIKLNNVDISDFFDELMESYCEAASQSKYEKTLKKIGQWVDEAREGYGIKK